LSEKLLRYKVIVIDEFGCLLFRASDGKLLFYLINKPYESSADHYQSHLRGLADAKMTTAMLVV
jgi:DNA replication protein DnaC